MGIGVKFAMATMPTSDKSNSTLEHNILITDELTSLDKKFLMEQDVTKNFKRNNGRRRASLDVLKECNTIEEAVKWSALRRRRTSLPTILAGTKKKAAMSSVLVETSTLVEIHFLADELTRNPSNVTALAKKLKELLLPYNKVIWFPKSLDVSDEGPPRVSPRHLPTKRPVQRRFDSQGGLFSTVTTATGLPKEEPGPIKTKRLPKIVKDKQTPIGTPLHSRCNSPVEDEPIIQTHTSRRQTFPNISISQAQKLSFTFQHHSVHKKFPTISSDYESDEPSPIVNSNHSLLRSKSVNDPHAYPPDSTPPEPTVNNIEEFYPPRDVITPPPDEDQEEHENVPSCYSRRGSQMTDEGFNFFKNYQNGLLENVFDWNFPIFELAEKTECVLSQMAFKLFQSTGLFDAFQIPKSKFVRYMRALENGYREIPYHNKIHAADVLHGCWFLSTQEIPGFQDNSPLCSSDSSDSDSGTSTVNPRQVNNIGHGSLAQVIPALELLALYLAAAMHDYDHPGKTNAFLVETRHPLATFYNDRSVLENHHASASWELLYSDKNFDFLEHLDTAEWKRLRFLIVEAILATDLKKHFEILSQFSNKAQQSLSRSTSIEDGESDSTRRNGINWSGDEDRLLVCQMVIKLADIGGPAKLKPLHVTWTKAICEEFFIQGDEERRLNVQVSPFMDRSNPQVAELQRTFINNLITPIVFSMHKSGILAGEIAEDHDLFCKQGQTTDQNLLVEQLNSNLNFWKTKTPYSGYDEMMEAFKFALPHRFSFSNFAQCREDNGVSTSTDGTHSTSDKENFDNSASKIEEDEVFDQIRTKPKFSSRDYLRKYDAR